MRFLVLLLAVGTSAAAAAAQRQTLSPAPGPRHALVAKGQPAATIVLPENPDRLETYAASEFQRYAQAMAGRYDPDHPRTREAAGLRPLVGPHVDRRIGRFRAFRTEPGTRWIRRQGRREGPGRRGAMPAGHAVRGSTTLVEREFGVRWCVPGELGEVVPKTDTLSVGTFRRQFKPSFGFAGSTPTTGRSSSG